MNLNSEARGALEKIIDDAIKGIPQQVSLFRRQSMKSELHLTKEEDFVLGMTWGSIMSIFIGRQMIQYQRLMMQNEKEEMLAIILKRTREMRDAIFNVG